MTNTIPKRSMKILERAAWRFQWLETLLQDMRYGLRQLRRNRGFTVVAVLTLALGIGANTAMFSVVDAVLLHSLPYKDPARLVWLTESLPNTTELDNHVSWLDMLDWKSQNRVLSDVAGYTQDSLALTGSSITPQMLPGQFVSEGYFNVLGVAPLLGRTFTPEENLPGGPPAVVLSYSFWMQHFAGDPAAIGKALRLNDESWTIVGIMPAGFGDVTHTTIWAPFEQLVPKRFLTQRQFSWSMYAIARLKPGITFEQARTNMRVISQRLEQEYPRTTGGVAVMLSLRRYLVGDVRPALLMLSAAVFFLLLTACANIASLLLARAVGRQKEISIRLALGAGKWRLFRQLIVESMVLSLAGALLGLVLAELGTKLFVVLLPANAPFSNLISINGSVLVFTLALTLLAGLLFGLAPATTGLKVSFQGSLKSGTHQIHGSQNRAHRALVITEIGLAATLLIGAGLMLRSMLELFKVAPGFDTHQLLTETVVLDHFNTLSLQQSTSRLDQVVRRIEQLPGVGSVAAGFPAPFTVYDNHTFLAIKGRPPQPEQSITVPYTPVSTSYFSTLRIPLIEGRTFTAADRPKSLPVAIVDQELATRYWPSEDPVGRQIKLHTLDFGDPSQTPLTIVGVVGTVKASGLDTDLGGQVYQPYEQHLENEMTFIVRSQVAPLSLARSVKSAIHQVMPDSPVFNVQSTDEVIEASQATRRLSLRLLSGFSVGALFLAALGLYGVISYIVSQSTHEIGVRMALGAQRSSIVRLILGQGMRLALWGIAAGVVAALALTWLMTSLLYSTSATDPFTYAGVAILLTVVTLLACYIPARRAMNVDPMVALHYE